MRKIFTTALVAFMMSVSATAAFALSPQEEQPGVRGNGSFTPTKGGEGTRALSEDEIRQIVVGGGTEWEGESPRQVKFKDEYRADGTYTGTERGQFYNGNWMLKGGSQMCFRTDGYSGIDCYHIAYNPVTDRVYYFDKYKKYKAYGDRNGSPSMAGN